MVQNCEVMLGQKTEPPCEEFCNLCIVIYLFNLLLLNPIQLISNWRDNGIIVNCCKMVR
jgi:hypothetical protein